MKRTFTKYPSRWRKLLSVSTMLVLATTLQAQIYFNEDFSTAAGTTPPAGWSNTAVSPTLEFWNFDNPGAQSITGAGFSGKFVIVDSDFLGGASTQYTRLTSPFINLSTSANPYLQFSEQFRSGFGGTGSIEYSIDSGNTWVGVASRGPVDVGYTTPVITRIPVPAVAGHPGVKFRWTYTGTWAWWWAIDAVVVAELTAPIIQTGNVSAITTIQATLHGNIISDGGSAITRGGMLISATPNSQLGDPGVTDSICSPGITSGPFSFTLTGLTIATTYYYRAYAVNAIDTTYGADSSFSTNAFASTPTVATLTASNIESTTASVGGTISLDGGAPVTTSGIVVSTSPNPMIGGAGVIDSVTTPLVAMGNFTISLSSLTQSTKYYFRSYAINSIGISYSNLDSFTTQIVISAFPYFENFDSAITLWTSAAVNGGTNDWQRGTPGKPYLNAAFSAPNAFVTKLTGNYAGTSNCAVRSPQFDCSALANDPVIRFKHKFDEDSDDGYDGGVVQISINGGAWATLDNTHGSGADFITPSSTKWYNDNSGLSAVGFTNSFSGLSSNYASQAGGWISSMTPLTGAAGQNNVRIRFYFGADYTVDEGWAIDNIEILNSSAPTVLTTNVTNLAYQSATLNGNISDNGLLNIIKSGVVLSTSPNPSIGDLGVVDSTTNPYISLGAFSVSIAGLTPTTQYYYRAYAINAADTSYGGDSTFTTKAAPTIPAVSATTIGAPKETTATLRGTILSNGDDPIILSGMVYSDQPNPFIGGIGVIDSTTNPLVTSGSFNFNLTNLNNNTKYYYRSYAINSIGTAYSAMDSFTTKKIYNTLPYAENFDGSTASEWLASSLNATQNAWELGSPSKTVLNGTHSGPNAWVTKLSGNYGRGVSSVVVSPQFDFSSQVADPILTFSNKFLIAQNVDVAVVEMSINNGPFTIIDNTLGTGTNFTTPNDGIAWYNNTNTGVAGFTSNAAFSGSSANYSSQSSGWIQSSARLIGAAGQSNVRIRVRFGSTTLPFYPLNQGIAFDDVTITQPSPATVVTASISNITLRSVAVAGNITNTGRSPVTVSGIVVGTTSNPSIGDVGVIDSVSHPHVSKGGYSITINGLLPSTTYICRAYAINAVDTSYGGDSSFTTSATATLPSLYITSPSALAQTTVTLNAAIANDGGYDVTSSGIVYSLTTNPSIGDINVVDSTTNPLVSLGAYHFNLTGLTHSTQYYYRAYAVNAIGVAYSNLDSFTTHPIITSFPYTQNFEGGTAGWTTAANGGLLNPWEFGTPAKTFINGAYSGTNAFVTKLTGNYSNTANTDGVLISPQIDLSTATNPVMRFKHKFDTDTDPNWDAAVVEISINGGTWTRLNSATGIGANFNTTTSYAWYNNGVASGTLGSNKFGGKSTAYSSTSSGWLESATLLTGAAGQSNVRVRFRFWADAGSADEGWEIDDIEIVDIVAPSTPASAVNLTSITGNSTTVNWTNGDGQGRIVVARLSSTVAVAPTNNKIYNANTIFGSGDSTGLGNKIVFKGTTSLVSVSNLDSFTNYTYDVYEYNGKYMHIQFAAAASNNATTLPVTLTNFTATAKTKDALLNWTTASETNNREFEIERSLDGRSFESVGFVKGAGNSNIALHYTYTDVAAFAKAGVWYYRLKQVDVDGKYTYSQIVKVSINTIQISSASVHPNPFKSDYTVSFNATKQGLAQLELMDMQGRVVATTQLNVTEGSNIIPVTETAILQPGMYFLKLTINTESQTLKLVKE